MISTSEIRDQFLEYFRERGHSIVPSSPLVPGNDPTLLFTNAGMVQFKELFLGLEKRGYSRATTSQRCVRAGGKHNDLENVGYTARHHTFFEMLGNFSFGDYFKEDAIRFCWEFLTECLGLPADKLWVTVFEEDDEAYDIWAQQIGVPEERIARIGAKDNFWQMGDTGPCGPCSEVFFDHGPDVWGGPPGTPEEDGDRYIEIWNLVFMQFDRQADGSLVPLPKPSVDTGMGLERIAAVLQGVHSNYEIDLFQRLLLAAAEAAGTSDLESASLKVVADHIRSCAFMIVDGVMPSNEGRGYVLRRILRRAIRHGYKLGQSELFFHKLVAPLVAEMGAAYPELAAAAQKVEQTILLEEQRFAETLEHGMKLLEEAIARLDGDSIPGEVLFKLYDTYGFPLDLTADIARERKLAVDEAGFERQMEAQRQRARAASHFGADHSQRISVDTATEFTGYERLDGEAEVLALYRDGEPVEALAGGQSGIVLLDRTPFYGESGGQVGDSGELCAEGLRFVVCDAQKSGDGVLHIGEIESGELRIGARVAARVDAARRRDTVLNHSATHLLHEALRRSLGEHVQQKGSLVRAEYLRFDFSHNQPLHADELACIENWVNAQIRDNLASDVRQMSIDEARQTGATMLFGEKYGDVVRVVSIGGESTELCGGTHVARAGDIGLFKITAEGGIAAGVRRIEAVTGHAALVRVHAGEQRLAAIAELLKASRDDVDHKVAGLVERSRQQAKEIDRLKARLASAEGGSLGDQAIEVAGVNVLAVKLPGADAKTMRDTLDQLKNKLVRAAVVLATEEDGKVRLAAGVSKELTGQLKAGELVNAVAEQVGGRGGGRPDMAQAGGDRPENLDAALASVPDWVRRQLA